MNLNKLQDFESSSSSTLTTTATTKASSSSASASTMRLEDSNNSILGCCSCTLSPANTTANNLIHVQSERSEQNKRVRRKERMLLSSSSSSSSSSSPSSSSVVIMAATTALAAIISMSSLSPANALIINKPYTHHFPSQLNQLNHLNGNGNLNHNHVSLVTSVTSLNMVSATERIFETVVKSPIRTTKVAAVSTTGTRTRRAAATATATATRRSTTGAVAGTKSRTGRSATNNNNNKGPATRATTRTTQPRAKATTRTRATKARTRTVKLEVTRKNGTRRSNTSTSTSTSSKLAQKTAESLYNLPSYVPETDSKNSDSVKNNVSDAPTPATATATWGVANTKRAKNKKTTVKRMTTVTAAKPQKKSTMLNSPSVKKTTSNTSTSTSTSTSTNNNNNNNSMHNQNQPQTKSRSSTMPGFRNNRQTKRHTAFRDGIKIVKEANSKNHNSAATAKIKNIAKRQKSSRSRQKANSEAMYASSASVPDSLIAFTNEIHLEERITPKEELELGTLTQEAIRLQKLHDDLITEYGREPSDDEWCAAAGKINMETLQNAIEDGIHAKNQLVTANLRMVQGVVNLYIRNGLGSQYNAGDLMQEGTVALIRAAEKFEPQRGFRFSTYAMYWIRAAVKRSQILQSRVINVPQRLHETHKKVGRLESQLKKELGRKPSKSELAQAAGISENQLDRCMKAISQQCFSLDAEIANTLNPNRGNNSAETSYNLVSAKYDDVEYRELQSHFMKGDLVTTLRRYLSPHEVDLLLLRYGLMDEKTLPYGFSGPLTIAEVSRLVDLKPDKVRRMINKSLRQLRHLIAHEWEDFENVLQRY